MTNACPVTSTELSPQETPHVYETLARVGSWPNGRLGVSFDCPEFE